MAGTVIGNTSGENRGGVTAVNELLVLRETTPGSYFVSNYPPYAFWRRDNVGEAFAALDRAPQPDTPLGIYVHIPFCRKRCHFCYFKVYTEKNAGEVEGYIDAVLDELTLYSHKAVIGGRKPKFIYFGGGTPSYMSTRQLTRLVEGMKRNFPWDEAEEVAFECEPGTLTEGKIRGIRELGVTRLSLGIENFNDEILLANGRAHSSKEIGRAFDIARVAGFPQINIDLISGMVGETEENWQECVRRTIDMAPDSVTIYQMEIPYNTTIFKEMKAHGESVAPVATWETKRNWVRYAFAELERSGYTVGSAYTAVKDPARSRFLYRDLLWAGADMIGVGVASFSHVQGTHFQNESDLGPYGDRLREGAIPLARALTPTPEERMIREFVLQLKLGHVSSKYFQVRFGVDIQRRFAEPVSHLQKEGLMSVEPGGLRLSREGLLQVDGLLPLFFLPVHRSEPRV